MSDNLSIHEHVDLVKDAIPLEINYRPCIILRSECRAPTLSQMGTQSDYKGRKLAMSF